MKGRRREGLRSIRRRGEGHEEHEEWASGVRDELAADGVLSLKVLDPACKTHNEECADGSATAL